MKKILLISDFDSRLAWGVGVINLFKDLGYEASILILRKNKPETSEILEIFKENINYTANIENAKVYELAIRTDIVVLAVGGAAHVKFFYIFNNHYYDSSKSRPLVLSGFNGMVDNTNPHGMLCRLSSDYLLVNSLADLSNFEKTLNYLGVSYNPLVLSGYIRNYLPSVAYEKNNKNSVICYVDQVLIFKNNHEREYVASCLLYIAIKNPDKKLFVKLREKKNTSDPKGKNKNISFYIEKIKKSESLIVHNIVYEYGEPSSVIEKSHHLIGFSSTLLVEGLVKGRNVSIITDLGISHQFGNHVFIGSNLFSSFNDIANGKINEVDECWAEENIFYDQDYLKKLAINIDAKLNDIKHRKNFVDQYYSPKEYPFFFRRIINVNPYKGVIKNEFLQKIKEAIAKAKAFLRRCKKE